MSVESQISKLEDEIKMMKASFEQSAAQMPMFSSEIIFTTSRNSVNYTYPQSINPLQWETIFSMPQTSKNTACETEPIIVTFSCPEGINTFANLEIEFLEGAAGLFVTNNYRIQYNGGARWLVTVNPNVTMNPDGWYSWSPSRLRFIVKSAVKGTLGAKMIWQ